MELLSALRQETHRSFPRPIIMLRRLFTVFSALSALICLLILFIGIWSYFANVDTTSQLPGGIELSASGCAGKARLGITRWGRESDKWWQNRPAGQSMSVTGKTVILSQNPIMLYAANIYVNFNVDSWHGVEWRSGAMSKTPSTQPTGVMSMALVPYWSTSIPWLYALPVFAILPAIWLIVRVRKSKPQPGCCKTCGYDLRGSPGKCPECGTIPE